MVFSIRGFAIHETPNELLSLLLEDVLIKSERPIYNIRGQDLDRYVYVELTDDAYPTCRVVVDANCATKTYGPFRDQYLAADIVGIVNRHFHMRWCNRRPALQKKPQIRPGGVPWTV